MCYLQNLQPNLHEHLISSCKFPMYCYVTHPHLVNNWEHDTRMQECKNDLELLQYAFFNLIEAKLL
jgi:hypothetical protein